MRKMSGTGRYVHKTFPHRHSYEIWGKAGMREKGGSNMDVRTVGGG
jgi:hypothetical protein